MQTIMITEEKLRIALKEAFMTGYVERMNIPFDNDYLRLAYQEAAAKAQECKPFLDSLFSSLDDRAPAKVASEAEEDFDPLDLRTA